MNNILEISRTIRDEIVAGNNVVFNTASPYSEGITYDPATGEIILTKTGIYSVKWWVATETVLTGCIQFALKSSQGDVLMGCSSTKRGQVIGFGSINAKTENVTLSLVNVGDHQVILSRTSSVTASLVAERIPDEGIIPTFDIQKVETLAPGEDATVELAENVLSPNDWLFSFGIPQGQTGAAGDSPHIDTDTGHWFVGAVDTHVQAQGPQGITGPTGPSATIIPFSIGKYGVVLSCDVQGDPMMIAFSGFGGSYYDPSTYLLEGEWATGTITIRDDMNFGTSFVMPHKGTLKNIHILFSNSEPIFELDYTIKPFICLAVSTANTPVYTIWQDTLTFTEPYVSGTNYLRSSLKKGFSSNLNLEIEEGTLVGIIVGTKGEGNIYERHQRFTISGGLYLE